MAGDLNQRVADIVCAHRQVRSVRLAGSRARGTATAHSDWDFQVDAADFPTVATDLPALVQPLGPLAQHEPEPPWRPGVDTVSAIDAHFWDWLLWLAGKRHRGQRQLIHDEMARMYRHLLQPLGVAAVPDTLEEAAAEYLVARARVERRFAIRVPRRLQEEVQRLLGTIE